MSTNPTLRVLLVEDSSLLAARLTEVIRRLPDVDLIGVVDTQAAALTAIQSSLPDVVILDLRLREGTGFGVLRNLARETARPKTVVLTNYDLSIYRRQAELLGVSAFLDKSRDYHRLPQILRDLASERTSTSDRC